MGPRASRAPEPVTRTARSPHVAALDGIRALAVAVVLAFHMGYPWASGGFLGVSVFFTLSGYLITSLLLTEHRRSTRIDLGGFYRRRIGRLLPASLLGVMLALLVVRRAALVAPGVRGDFVATLAQVANWRWLLSTDSYADLFAVPSPLLHYWSLAIEEQFYLLYAPLVAWALRSSIRRLHRLLLGGLIASWLLLAGLVLADKADLAYYATPVRFGEILAGGLLGLVAAPTRLGARAPRLAGWGWVALGAIGFGVATANVSGRWTYLVWLPITALATLALIAAATASGSLSRVLSWAPLVGIGRISYGIYVYHWPVLLFLTEDRTGLGPLLRNVLCLAVTLALATLSFVFVERPVLRWARRPRATRRRLAVPAVAWGVAFAAVMVGTANLKPAPDLEAASKVVADDFDGVVDPNTPFVNVFGDSTAAVFAVALTHWGGEERDLIGVPVAVTPLGCGIELRGERRGRGGEGPISDKCFDALASWRSKIEASAGGGRVALIASGPWEVTDHRFPGDTWRHLGDPVLDAAYLERFRSAVDELLAGGAERIVWLTTPPLDPARLRPELEGDSQGDPARMERYNELVRQVAAEVPQVVVLDLASLVESWPEDVDRDRRVDGIHFSPEAADELVDTWLGPKLLEVIAALDEPAGVPGGP